MLHTLLIKAGYFPVLLDASHILALLQSSPYSYYTYSTVSRVRLGASEHYFFALLQTRLKIQIQTLTLVEV